MQPPGRKLQLDHIQVLHRVIGVISNHNTLRYLADMMPTDQHVANCLCDTPGW